MKSGNAGFVLGALVLAAIIAAGAYFLLFSPALAAGSQAREDLQEAREFNELLELQILQKRAEFGRMDEYLDQIEEISSEIPATEQTATMRRQINAILAAESLQIRRDNLTDAAVVVPGQVILAPAAYAVGRESYVDGLVFRDLYATTIDYTVQGQYANVWRAIARLQMYEDRYFLLTSVSILAPSGEVPNGGVEANLQIQIFTLYDPASGADVGAGVDPNSDDLIDPVMPGDILTPRFPAPPA